MTLKAYHRDYTYAHEVDPPLCLSLTFGATQSRTHKCVCCLLHTCEVVCGRDGGGSGGSSVSDTCNDG
jgi:hypothetical protein